MSSRADEALFELPAGGPLLVARDPGTWVVQPDGAKRLLAGYDDAAWSPFGRFVVAVKGSELVALEPDGDTRWTLARRAPAAPSWGGSRIDTRIAYVSAGRLRVVGGDGRGDRALGRARAVRPAWRPRSRHVVTYADTAAASSPSTSRRARARFGERRRAAASSRCSGRATAGGSSLPGAGASRSSRATAGRSAGSGSRAARSPQRHSGPEATRSRTQPACGGRSQVVLVDEPSRVLFSGPGAFTDVAWSNDGAGCSPPGETPTNGSSCAPRPGAYGPSRTCGRSSTRPRSRDRRVVLLLIPEAAAFATLLLGRSELGTPIRAHRAGDAASWRKVLVVGCIHGDECAGTEVVRALRRARPNADLWLVPNLNPDGRRRGVRVNGRGVDLNRNFPRGWRRRGRPVGRAAQRRAAVVGAGDADRAQADPPRPARRHDLVPPAAGAGSSLGREHPGGSTLRPPRRRAVPRHPLAERHRAELAEPPLLRHDLVRRRAAARPDAARGGAASRAGGRAARERA